MKEMINMYFKKFAALLFALAILLGSLSFSANAVSIASVIGTLETKAINYTSLCVWGNVSRPIPVNTTLSLLGTANTTCYRMMIKITAPNGTITRQEATNASVVSKSYNFSQVGLYTIEIFGRDLPESNTWSSTDTHVYKIRVY